MIIIALLIELFWICLGIIIGLFVLSCIFNLLKYLFSKEWFSVLLELLLFALFLIITGVVKI